MKKTTLSLIFALLPFLVATTANAQTCTFQLDKDSVVVQWTAYKTTQKTGVKGSFKKINVDGKTEGKSVGDLLKGITVSVDKLSVDTGNPARDKTLADFFFAKLGDKISGKIKKFSEPERTFELALDFNGHTKNVPMRYEAVGDNSFTATGDMDILKFDGASALKSLNTKCLDLHKGPDGVSKTWSDVTLNIKGNIKKSCK
jgi:polyisoprenoid-binding protein YceI